MSISSSNRKAGPFACNGATVAFPFSFKVFTTADVRVVLTDSNSVESDLALGTNYTVALNADQDANPGGTVTTTATYATGYKITLTSQVQNLQPLTLTNQGGFYPQVINNALDRATVQVQQLAEQVGRAVKTPISSGMTPDELLASIADADANAEAAAAAAGASASDANAAATAAAASAAALETKLSEFVSIKDAGVTAAALNEVIEYLYTNGGGEVRIPPGNYTFNETVVMRSNVTVRCAAGVVINANSFSGDFAFFGGSASAEYPLTVEAGLGGQSVTVSGSPSISGGDLIHLVSVKNAANRTDAGDYWLGDGTVSLPYCYFAEFNRVSAVVGGGVFSLSTPLLFPGYKINASGETETGRTTSAIQKITPCENAHWIGGKIIRNTNGASVFNSLWAYRSSVQDVVIERGDKTGSSVQWSSSLECTAQRVINNNSPLLVWDYDTMHSYYNRFKTVGSQDCGFIEVKDSHGGQSVDFTYGSAGYFCNVRSFCRDSTFFHCFEGLTSHPGCYQEAWTDNRILSCYDDGITIRGLEAVVCGNLITAEQDWLIGTMPPGSGRTCVGVRLMYGSARRALLSKNIVRGFYAAFDFYGDNSGDKAWLEVNSSIQGNEISRCYIGLDTASLGSLNNSPRRINYLDNHHSLMGRYVVKLDAYSAGVSVKNNVLDGAFRYATAGGFVAFLYASGNSPALEFVGNTWNRPKGSNAAMATKYMFYAGNITDTTVYPATDWAAQTVVANNTASFADSDSVVMALFGAANYIQQSLSQGRSPSMAIASGSATLIPKATRQTLVILDTEASAATDDLDTIAPYTNVVFQTGDIVYIRSTSGSRAITIRDVTTSGAASYGFQTPGNASITLGSSNDVVTAMFAGTYWLIISQSING